MDRSRSFVVGTGVYRRRSGVLGCAGDSVPADVEVAPSVCVVTPRGDRTIVALILASVLTHGITIDGMAPWVATTVVVWLVTTIGAITLPELLIRDESGST